jgi:hypothetical protein
MCDRVREYSYSNRQRCFMRFEKVKEIKKDDKVHKLIDDFIKTNYDRVEVINEDDYKNNNAMTSALRWVIKNDYADKVKASKIRERVYLSKIDFEYKE